MSPVLLVALALLAAAVLLGVLSTFRVPPAIPEPPAVPDAALIPFRNLVADLESLGFYRYTDPARLEQVKAEAAEDQFLFAYETGRSYWADAQWLAEGGVMELLEELAPFLARQGVAPLTVSQTVDEEGAYTVTVNGTPCSILPRAAGADEAAWERALSRTAALVSLLLRQAGSPERAYLLYAGIDAELVFLTPAMHRAMRDARVFDERELPREVGAQH